MGRREKEESDAEEGESRRRVRGGGRGVGVARVSNYPTLPMQFHSPPRFGLPHPRTLAGV